MGVGGVILALREDVTLSWILVVIVPLVATVIGTLMYFAVPLFQSMQVKIDRINQVLREQITGVRVIRAFNRTPNERDRFEVANQMLTLTGLRVNRMFALGLPVLMLIMNLSSVAIVWFGGHLIDGGQMPVGNLFAFLAYIMQIFWAMMLAVMMVIFIPRAAASGARLHQVLSMQPSITDPPAPVEPAQVSGDIEFRDVTFGYPGGEKPVLRELSFRLQPGGTTAIIGGTGAGKTTLLTLIGALRTAHEGKVEVLGRDLSRVTPTGLVEVRRDIGFIFQMHNLFDALSAFENVKMAAQLDDASSEDMRRRSTDILQRLGLGHRIQHKPRFLSGGERQRVAIGRALVNHPRLILADEPTAHLDYVQVEEVLALIRELAAPGRLVVVATHDDRFTPLADRVIELAPKDEEEEEPAARAVELAAGEVLFTQGEPAHRIYVVEEGEIEIYRPLAGGGEELNILRGPGSYFGELGPLLGFPRAGTARARSAAVVTGYTVPEFREMVGADKIANLLGKASKAKRPRAKAKR
jgi:ATP-binding cassette subfamily B protein